MIKALEKKTDSKFVLIEKGQKETNDELAKLRKDLNDLNNAHSETVKRVADNKERIDILFGMIRDLRDLYDKLKKELNDLRDFIDRKLKEITDQLELLMSFSGDSKGKFGEGDLKIIADILKRLGDLERNFNKYVTEARIEELWKLVLELKEKMKKKASKKDLEKLEEKVETLKNDLEKVKNDLSIVIDETHKNSDDIYDIYKKIEEIMGLIHGLKNALSAISSIKGGDQIDFSKFVSITVFDGFKSETEKSIKDILDELDRLRRLINDILDQLKHKIGEKELKELEDYLMKKIEELAVACNKKFADKNETARNFRYLEEQIKHILSLLMKKDDKGDNWMFAKRPLMDFTCASCEAYIGELKDNGQYIPWNKYPMRDPNNKLYRLGSGFSRMLQMVNVDGSQGTPMIENKREQPGYQTSDVNAISNQRKQNEQKEEFKSLPKINKRENDYVSIDDMHQESQNDQNINEEDEIQPKVTKIYKKNKKDAK